ncbi:RNA polymerase sigma factor [Chitinophaga arvensicola]|uniref:RNA polymerase sigma-70 factor, ECF subfamily n=1 Tax=Chitinophaga arvensicola TaxID=29529 RepID=A0A1I0RUI9_9BACT|nr:sigma-70 family RNA polymerase sigma factor [Chitinophaga arvensicola]SEW44978.1 RNA polymerase sigma-70 factor, ECF subfamily [Chitinophaga arvensicola]
MRRVDIHEELPDEQTLLQRIADGDSMAFALLFKQYKQNLYSTIFHLTGSSGMAEDVLQEVFIKVWMHRARLPDIINFPGWLYKVTEYAGFKVIRNNRRIAAQLHVLSNDPFPPAEKDPVDIFIEKEYDQLLEAAIAQLPEKQQLTYRMIKQQGLKRKEVAERLSVSPETVKWNLDQANQSVRNYCMAHLGLTLAFMLVNSLQ